MGYLEVGFHVGGKQDVGLACAKEKERPNSLVLQKWAKVMGFGPNNKNETKIVIKK